MNKTENKSCVSSVIIIAPVSENKIKKWVANSILKQTDYGVYICTCTVTNVD